MSKVFVADFETTTNPQDCRVWAFAIVDIDDPDNKDNVIIGTDIYEFINWCSEQKGSPKIYIGGSLNTPIETNNSNINEIYINKKPHIINIHEEALVFDIINIAKKATIPPSNIFIIIKIISIHLPPESGSHDLHPNTE